MKIGWTIAEYSFTWREQGPVPPKEDYEKSVNLEVAYFSVISALMYLKIYIRSNILFSVNLFERYSYAPT